MARAPSETPPSASRQRFSGSVTGPRAEFPIAVPPYGSSATSSIAVVGRQALSLLDVLDTLTVALPWFPFSRKKVEDAPSDLAREYGFTDVDDFQLG